MHKKRLFLRMKIEHHHRKLITNQKVCAVLCIDARKPFNDIIHRVIYVYKSIDKTEKDKRHQKSFDDVFIEIKMLLSRTKWDVPSDRKSL